jgi:hypothetical protein
VGMLDSGVEDNQLSRVKDRILAPFVIHELLLSPTETTSTKRFRERGLEGIGVADVMKEAGVTVGGFYTVTASGC